MSIATQDSALQTTLLTRINAYRLEHGLSPLKLNNIISNEAKNHSQDMAKKTVGFGHDGFKKRMKKIFSQMENSRGIAENVAYVDGDVKDVVNMWLQSRGHRNNILGHYNLTGIGIAYDKNGRAYATQIFVSATSD